MTANLENKYLNDVSCKNKSTDDLAGDTLGTSTYFINKKVVPHEIWFMIKVYNLNIKCELKPTVQYNLDSHIITIIYYFTFKNVKNVLHIYKLFAKVQKSLMTI